LSEDQMAWQSSREQKQAELAEERRAAQDAEKQARDERQRLQILRRRLYQRWKRHFAAERTRLHASEETLRHKEQVIEQDCQRLQQDQQGLEQARLAHNTDVELSKRELQERWTALKSHQSQEEEKRKSQERDIETRARVLAERETSLAWKERLLIDQERQWKQKLLVLERESEGLENRIRNQRCRLATLHSESEAKNNSEESALAGWTLVWSKDASAPPIPTTPSTVQAAQSVRTPTAIRDSNDPPSEQPAPALLDLE